MALAVIIGILLWLYFPVFVQPYHEMKELQRKELVHIFQHHVLELSREDILVHIGEYYTPWWYFALWADSMKCNEKIGEFSFIFKSKRHGKGVRRRYISLMSMRTLKIVDISQETRAGDTVPWEFNDGEEEFESLFNAFTSIVCANLSYGEVRAVPW